MVPIPPSRLFTVSLLADFQRRLVRCAAASQGVMERERVRLFVFDFDQTLSVSHVFKALAGWPGTGSFSVPPPFATSEIGQMVRMEQLNQCEYKAGGFAQAAFGGPQRVADVCAMLRGLQAEGAELFVCTKGLVGTVQKCLSDLDLLQHFAEVYGQTGNRYGLLDFDKHVEVDEKLQGFLGKSHQASWASKDRLVASLMKQKGLRMEQAVLVEDDVAEVRSASGVCRTLLVKEAKGLTNHEMDVLLSMAGAQTVEEQQGAPEKRRCSIM